MLSSVAGWFLVTLVFGQALSSPVVYLEPEAHSLGRVSELGQRLAAHARLPGPSALGSDQRLALPTPQELDAIKKVAQILVMLGEQVIPAIIGDTSPFAAHASCDSPAHDIPNDPVNE